MQVIFFKQGLILQDDAEASAEALESAIEAANNGDAEAMYDVGIYYLEHDDIPAHMEQSWPWFIKAAEQGHVLSAGTAVTISAVVACPRDCSQAYKHWCEAYKCVQIVLRNVETPKFYKSQITRFVPRILFEMGYCAYLTAQYGKDYYDIEKQLTPWIDNMDVDDGMVKCVKVLLGLVYVKLKNYAAAFPLLQLIEAGDITFNHVDVQYSAWMELASLYKMLTEDVESSYRCVLAASQIPGDISNGAKEELKKYRKIGQSEHVYQEN